MEGALPGGPMVGRTIAVLLCSALAPAALAGEAVTDGADVAVEETVGPVRPPSLAGLKEASVSLGSVFGDPWVRRHTIGLRLALHPSDTFSVEASGVWSPDFGSGDFTPPTRQLLGRDRPLPDIVKIRGLAAGTVHFTPLRGTVGGARRVLGLGLYGLAGFGALWTQDDSEALQCSGGRGEPCTLTLDQVHATMILGGGLRVAGRRTIGRLELRDLAWVETFNGTSLETKHRLLAELSVGLVFGGPPAMRRRVPDEAFTSPPSPASR